MSTEVKDVLAAIKKTSQLKDKIRAELGLDKDKSATKIPDDIYQFEYKKPDLETRSWTSFHGKCIDAGQKQLLDWGYEFLQIGHISQSDKSRAGAVCNHCNIQLDAETYKNWKTEQKLVRETKRAEYLEEKAIRLEWEAEQILLGKM